MRWPSAETTTRSGGSRRSGCPDSADGKSDHLQRPSRGRSCARVSDGKQTIKDQSISSLEKLAEKFGHDVIDVEALKPAFDNFQMRITPAALDQIKEVGDPMWQQYVPTVEELDVVDGVIDSLDEDADSPVPNITHRYPDRALFLDSTVCASYFRFCTRRRKVGDPEKISLKEYESAFQYLAAHPEIRDVILSGGDPV